jgi:hypothetical protein
MPKRNLTPASRTQITLDTPEIFEVKDPQQFRVWRDKLTNFLLGVNYPYVQNLTSISEITLETI